MNHYGYFSGGIVTLTAWAISLATVSPIVQFIAATTGSILGVYGIAVIIKKEYKIWKNKNK